MFVDNRAAQSSIDPQPSELTQEQRQDVAKKLRERLAERRQEAAKKGLKDAEGLFRELEKQTEKLAQAKDASRQQSLVKINDLAKQLEKRREKLGGEQQLRKQLEKLNSMNRGPADKLVEAMKKGDFQAAQQELKKIQQQLKAGQLDEQAKQQLQQQLAEIQEKLSAAQEAREQAIASLKKQIQQQQQQGNLSKAGELQQKLDQMQQQQNSMNPMQQLAQKMGDCQKCMQQGDAQGASQALDQMLEQMQQLEQQAAEGQMLDAALDQLQMTKDSMSCSSCQGAGCQACQGGGYSDQLGEGKNLGRGGGSRPDQKNEVRFRDTRVRQKPGKGSAVVVGEADGPNLRGQVIESVKTQMATEASQPADPLAAEQLPKSRREHNEQYFNSLRGE
jgi:DNA repair exonuclease SbcCD ATPase subunit